jgi:hypothetical protein
VSTPVSISGSRSQQQADTGAHQLAAQQHAQDDGGDGQPSIQPLALTSCEAGSSSVRMPYLAGE